MISSFNYQVFLHIKYQFIKLEYLNPTSNEDVPLLWPWARLLMPYIPPVPVYTDVILNKKKQQLSNKQIIFHCICFYLSD